MTSAYTCQIHALMSSTAFADNTFMTVGSLAELVYRLCWESVFICNMTDRPQIIKGLDLLTTLTLFACQSKWFTGMWPLLHAKNFLEPQVSVGCQVGTNMNELLPKISMSVNQSEVLSLLITCKHFLLFLDIEGDGSS